MFLTNINVFRREQPLPSEILRSQSLQKLFTGLLPPWDPLIHSEYISSFSFFISINYLSQLGLSKSKFFIYCKIVE